VHKCSTTQLIVVVDDDDGGDETIQDVNCHVIQLRRRRRLSVLSVCLCHTQKLNNWKNAFQSIRERENAEREREKERE